MKCNSRTGTVILVSCFLSVTFLLAGCSAGKSQAPGMPDAGTIGNQILDKDSRTEGNTIGLSEAENIALAHAEVKASEVKFIKTELDYEDGRAEYELEFISDTYKYEYDISAADGSIRKFSKETLTGVQNPAPADTPTVAQTVQQTEKITLDEAKKIALDYAGLNEADVRFIKTELDYDHGVMEYEIEFYFEQKEYEFKIDPSSGKILKAEIDH